MSLQSSASCGECRGSRGKGGGGCAGNKSISSSSSAPWTAATSSTAPFPSLVAPATPYISYRSPRAAFVMIRSVHAPITNVLHISISRPSSRHRGWRIRLAICGPHTINSALIVAANHLHLYVVVTNRWAGRSASIPLLRLGLGQSLS